LWEKYRGWTPYQYSGNNPSVASDPSGMEVNMNPMQSDDPEATTLLLEDLSTISGLILTTENGMLQYQIDESASNYSQTARDALIHAINSSERVTVWLQNSVHTHGRGDGMDYNAVELADYINSASSPDVGVSYGRGMNFLHELQHTIVASPDVTDVTHDNDNGWGSIAAGGAVEFANKIRCELGLPLRRSYGSGKLSTKSVIPFEDGAVNEYGTYEFVSKWFELGIDNASIEAALQNLAKSDGYQYVLVPLTTDKK